MDIQSRVEKLYIRRTQSLESLIPLIRGLISYYEELDQALSEGSLSARKAEYKKLGAAEVIPSIIYFTLRQGCYVSWWSARDITEYLNDLVQDGLKYNLMNGNNSYGAVLIKKVRF